MCASAQFHADLAHPYHAHPVTVLLVKKGCSSAVNGLLHPHLADGEAIIFHYPAVNQFFNLRQFLSGHSGKMSEVKPHAIRLHQRACLLHMVTKNLAQGRLQQVCGCMVTGCGLSGVLVNREIHSIPHLYVPLFDQNMMDYKICKRSGSGQHIQMGRAAGDAACITCLPPGFSIERGGLHYQVNMVTCRG